MLATVKTYYEEGKIILKEKTPVQTKTDVIITFLKDDQPPILKRIPGALKGKISIPDHFNNL